MATEKQISAKRENAQKSTGPVTTEGKAIASHNAVKSGLTGQTVLVKTADVAAYHRLIERVTDKFHPDGDEECALVQDLADTEWRLARIAPLEAQRAQSRAAKRCETRRSGRPRRARFARVNLEASFLAMGRMELAAEVAAIADPE